jgi:hypothetical protein
MRRQVQRRAEEGRGETASKRSCQCCCWVTRWLHVAVMSSFVFDIHVGRLYVLLLTNSWTSTTDIPLNNPKHLLDDRTGCRSQLPRSVTGHTLGNILPWSWSVCSESVLRGWIRYHRSEGISGKIKQRAHAGARVVNNCK